VIVGHRTVASSSPSSIVNPILTRAEGGFLIRASHFLLRLEFDALTYVGGDFEFERLHQLPRLRLPVLSFVIDGLAVFDNPVLSSVQFPSLTFLGTRLAFQFNDALTYVSVPMLSQVLHGIYFCSNAPSFVIPNPAMGTAASPGLNSQAEDVKGQRACILQAGNGTCDIDPLDICP
jgi:hypothetical protein